MSATPETLHGLVAERVREEPGRTAVSLGEARWTYGELDRRAAVVAARLRLLGVARGDRVAIAAGRSLETVAGILGVLRAGAAYVPLDPDYPAERLAFMWRDCGARALLTQERLRARVPAAEERVVLLDGTSEDGAADGESAAGPDDLAYVIYTSGSTGRPKGVMIAHRGAVNVIRENARLLRVDEGSRVLQLASLSFDASVLEIFTALSTGAELVLTPRETLLSGEALAGELRRRRITTIAIPPSLLDKVPEEDGDLPELAAIVVGGETCSAGTAARWAPGRRFVNAYAPTEATIYVTAHEVDPAAREAPPIGRAIAGGAAHVLSPDLRPVAGGEPGELCLGGVGLALGYLGRPALTAERFVPDPASGGHGARLYRSGDLGRRLPDGALAFLGRADHQVKLRGVRMELGEVEAVLLEHPGVRSAAAALRDDPAGEGGGEKRLVAWYVPREGAEPGAPELRRFLAERLPEAMVPGAFVRLDALPMAPTGKVDRRALPEPGRERPELESEYRAPATPTEEALAAVWADLLGLDRVGARDDLFALGGHSLIVTRIATRVRTDLGRELPLLTVFERPTVEALAAWLDGAEAAGEGAAAELPPIAPVPRDGAPLPVSFPQERVWFLLQLAPHAIAYNFQFTLRFRGGLRPDVLERALTEIVRRHEVLRTTFPAVDGRPVQEVHPPFRVVMPRIDLAALPEDRRLPEARAGVRREIRRGFDVLRLPLFRTRVFVLAPDDHLFLQVEHHFVHDGWSLAVYLREIRDLYAAYAQGLPSPLPELPVQYADFAAWQRSWMGGQAYERQLAYWREKLGGDLPALELPTDRPRPPAYTFRGGALRVDMPAELYAAARRFSREQGMTLFMTMLAAFYALLHRYTGQEDVLLGSGLANRRHRETEDLVGMVVNTVVLRGRPEGGASFRRLLEGVRSLTLEAHLHQDMPFERLVQELQPERDLSRNPLFQVLFSFHDAAVPDLDLPEVSLAGEIFEWHNGSAKSDLNVVVKPMAEQRVGRTPTGGEVLTMVWEYSADILDPETVERMWGHYQELLRGAIGDPARTLAELPLLTAAETAQVRGWEEAPAPGANEEALPVHRLVARRAAEDPGAPAVVDAGGDVLTYGELARRAVALAGRLRALPGWGGPEAVVALVTGRSPDTAVAALGALTAGGAYLPVDPEYPPERIAYMLEDSGAVAVVARGDLRGALPAGGPPVLAPDEEGETGELAGPEHPERLAYVIYTSGSTGRPKGVELTHRGLTNLVAWHRETYRIGPGDRAALLAGPGFDAAVWELWPYLAAGASLHVPPDSLRAAPEALLAWLAEQGITVAFLATPLAEAVLDAVRAGKPPDTLRLRAVLTGGDRLHRPPPAGLPFELVNHYGPTESTVVATAGGVGPGSRTPPPIGRPIAGLGARLLDRNLRRVPAGVPGELCVAGRGLARGYRGRPAWTAEAFVPDPAADSTCGAPGDRIYKTGDLARWLPDGRIEFLGRIDTQVQVRGFRVELGEIESVLADHPGVAEAVVLARSPAGGGEARLVGYVVHTEGEGGAPPEPEALCAWLARRLPEYMVPQVFVPIPEVPLTPNGKVDRAALAVLGADAEAAGEGAPDHVPPRTPVEELVAGIWAEVLGVEGVGVSDDFFHLGGHSLLATRVLSRVRDATGAEVPLAALFEERTVAGLAAAVERGRPGGGDRVEDRIPRRGTDGPVPLSYTQERLWFLDRLAPGIAAYVIGRTYRVAGALDAPALARALSEVVRRHQALRTRFTAGEDAPEQVIDPPAPVPLPVIDLSGLPEEAARAEAGRLAGDHARLPFDLAAGPVLRSALVRLGAGEHRWLVAVHHIASDGWSMGVFHREVAALYRALVRGAGAAAGGLPELPALSIQYPDFAAWQRERLRGPALEAQLGFWRRRLAGAPALLELPTDRPRPPLQRFRGAQVEAELPADLAGALDRLARRSGATRFMVFLAAFAALLARWSRQEDVVVGTPVAGRVRSELEPLIGFFVNTLPLRLELPPGAPFRELLARARAATLHGHAHQELPFEKLVEEVQPERNLSHSPLFQVLLTVQEDADAAPALEGVETSVVPLERRESRFDLELAVGEGASGGLGVRLRYDLDLFEPETARRMAGQLGTLLAAVAAGPEAAWEALPLLTEEERREVLEAAPGPDLPPAAPGDAPGIHREVLRQARSTPETDAVVWADGAAEERLTYRELAARAHRLARHLVALGAGPEAPVAVFLPRRPELVVALLAVLEAGGAYVPLDPDYPEERLRFILEDTRAPVVVTVEALAGRLPGHRAAVVRLDADAEAIAAAVTEGAAEPFEAAVAPETLAYVIYTSGSTGRPKGVAIPHRATQALLAWARGAFPPEELAGVLASTSVCFDLSVFEIFLPLTVGGRVILAETVLALPEHPARDEVTLVNTVPSAMAELVASGSADLPAGVRTVNLAGEPLRPDLADRLYERGVARVHDLYGPSEDTTYSTFALRQPGGPETIGRPVAGGRAHLLDPRMEPVAPGVPGEVVLGGAGLARGYLGRPGRTAASFVPDPFSQERWSEPGARLYRTGDLARRLPSGDLQFLGRIDHQVKVRGFRIELGEIEAALTARPEVREAVVVAPAGPSGEPGDRRLVAYAVPANGATDSEALREALAERLPAYMVPSVIALLPELPRLPNGKIDRKALTQVTAAAAGDGADHAPPETETEEALAAIWREVLGVDRVGARDDFFRLGGHSLLATRVMTRVKSRLGADLPLRALFQNPTLQALAREVDRAGQAADPQPARPTIRRLERTRRRMPEKV
jgi:amino acid adenylation domain-containing protein